MVFAADPLYVVPLFNISVLLSTVRLNKFDPKDTPDMLELANFPLAMDPASIEFVTVPVSPDPINVPEAAGSWSVTPVVPAGAA
jgi:hypothetical protein